MNVIQIATIAICPVLAYLAGLLIGIFLITKCMSCKAVRNKVHRRAHTAEEDGLRLPPSDVEPMSEANFVREARSIIEEMKKEDKDRLTPSE